MANWNRNSRPFSKPFEVGLHFTQTELEAMENKARALSRMDWTDKVKLIKQAQLAIDLQNECNAYRSEVNDLKKYAPIDYND